MTRKMREISIPSTDLWDTLFSRKDKDYSDDKELFIDPSGKIPSYTFSSLKLTTQHLASSLQHTFALKTADVLALFLQNNIHTPAITFATHYIGGIVSPANPAYTVRELVHHLRDSGARVLATQTSLLKVALEAARECSIPIDHVIVVDLDGSKNQDVKGKGKVKELKSFQKLVEEGKKLKQVKKVRVDVKRDLAYLVYSSGTTGLPKGVMLSHENVVSNLCMLDDAEGHVLKKEGGARVVSVLPMYHIYGLQCLISLPIFTGFTTYIMPSFDLHQFCNIIQTHKITYTYVAPPIVLHLAKNPVVDDYDLKSLKVMTSGAAPLTKDLIEAVGKRLGVEVKQAYGLSETSPVAFIQRKWNQGLGSNGPSVPNQQVKYMSPEGKEVPKGEQGELYIKGPHVFLGYHNNEAATKDCMTPDGFFKTGDIAREDSEGNMYITDRVKELIKYKGFQVAPAELEGLLMGHEDVVDVAVIGVQDERIASEVPMAFVVLKEGRSDGKEVREGIVKWLESRVAGHKRLRGGVRVVDAVPKSASGKILRRVLKDMLKEEAKKERREGGARL